MQKKLSYTQTFSHAETKIQLAYKEERLVWVFLPIK